MTNTIADGHVVTLHYRLTPEPPVVDPTGSAGQTRSMTMIEAIRDALAVMMARDERVVSFGEDAGYFGGVFRCTEGLQQEFGEHRSFDTPISESGIVGAAFGMAAYGLRPVAEIQFADYVYPGYDQIVSEAARSGRARPAS